MDTTNIMSNCSHSAEVENEFNNLYGKWTMYAHLPHDTDWSVNSYKVIQEITYVEESIALFKIIPDILVKNCMLFLMRDTIKPIWEDPRNRDGGCFSFKVSNKNVPKAWKHLCYSLMGETISTDISILNKITGASISPKKNFCIIKIWLSDCKTQNVNKLITISGLDNYGVLFKKTKPEW